MDHTLVEVQHLPYIPYRQSSMNHLTLEKQFMANKKVVRRRSDPKRGKAAKRTTVTRKQAIADKQVRTVMEQANLTAELKAREAASTSELIAAQPFNSISTSGGERLLALNPAHSFPSQLSLARRGTGELLEETQHLSTKLSVAIDRHSGAAMHLSLCTIADGPALARANQDLLKARLALIEARHEFVRLAQNG